MDALLTNKIILFVVLLALSAFFSASETAIVAMSRLKVLHLVEKKRKGSILLQKLKDSPHKTITTILIGNNVVNVAASVVATSIAFDLFRNHALSVATGATTLLLLVFGEIAPKSIATSHKEKISFAVAKPIYLLSFLFYPLVWVFEKLTRLLIKGSPKSSLITEEEIKTIIRAGKETGELEKDEAKLLERVFRFDDLSVSEIMTPRTEMVMISAELKLRDLANLLSKKSFSRIPVYRKSKDNVVGIVLTRDLIGERSLNKSITSIMERAFFVPETQKIDTLLKQLQNRRQHMAIVVDEYGALQGLVTMEDVLEEIVGDIMDEKDINLPLVRKVAKNEWMVQAKIDIQELNKKLKTGFKEDCDFETLGGFILKQLERIPQEDEELSVGNFRITVKSLDGNRIKEVRIEKK
ncbi:HlyC/CorC family transporter [Candidatus Woesearchaeota archaeon]|nr:HlyC/CorC family transporter [Candidatus Woesearchaeota archaeon]